MSIGRHRIAAAMTVALVCAVLAHAQTGADRDALLREALRLAPAWDSPAPEGDYLSASCEVSGIVALPDGSLLAVLAPESVDYHYGEDIAQIVRVDGNDGSRTELSSGSGLTLLAVDAGRGLAAAADRERVILFPTDDAEDPEDEWEVSGQVSALVFLSGGALATGGRDARVHVLRSDGSPSDLPLAGHAGTVNAVASVGELLLSGGRDSSVKVWDSRTGKLLRTLRPGRAEVVGLQPATSRQYVAVFLADGTGVTYDLQSFTTASTWSTGISEVSLCAFAADGSLAALHDGKDTVVVWDLARSREIERVSVGAGEEQRLTALAFTADRGRLVLGYSDGAISARVLETTLLGALAKAGLSEAERGSWLAESRLAAGAVDEAEALFRASGDRKGLALAGRTYLEHGAWEAAQRCLAEAQGSTAAAAAVGDACFEAQAFEEALGYYAQAGDAARLGKLAQVLFVRKDYSGAADAYSRAGDKAGLRRAADALYAAGSRLEAAELLVAAGERAAVSAWAASLLAARQWRAAGEICILIKDGAGARAAAASLLEAKDYEGAFELFLALGDRAAAKRIPDGIVTQASMLFRGLESYKDLPEISSQLGRQFSLAAEMYERGGMKDEVTSSLPAQIRNYDFIFPMIWYATLDDQAKIKEVADAAFSKGILIASLVGYGAAEDQKGIAQVAQALMRTKRYEEAAIAYGMLDDEAGLNAAAAALLAAGNAEMAEEIYRETGDKTGLAALAAAARRAGKNAEAAELYAMAGDAVSVYAIAAATERVSGIEAATDQYVLIPDPAILKREAARLVEAGYFAEARKLLEAADDGAGLASLAERYAKSGMLDEAVEIYESLGDEDSVERIGRSREAPARTSSGRQAAAETPDAKKKRAAAALTRDDYEEAGEAYGELGDYAGLMRVIAACLDEDASYDAPQTALQLARRFSYKPAFAAVAKSLEQAEDYDAAAECYQEVGDAEATRAFARRLIDASPYSMETAVELLRALDDKEGLALAARAVLCSEEPWDGLFATNYDGIVEGLGAEAASRLADEFIAEGLLRFPITYYVGTDNRAGVSRCAEAVLAAGYQEGLAASLYARIDDRQGLERVAEAALSPDGSFEGRSMAPTIYRRINDTRSLSRCAAAAIGIEKQASSDDYREAGRLYLEAGDAAGMLSVAEAYAGVGRPALAAHWARLAGDSRKAAAYEKEASPGSIVRVLLEASRTSDLDSASEGAEIAPWWHSVVEPLEADPGESDFSAEIRLSLEADGFVVITDATEGQFDLGLTLVDEQVETEAEADRISFTLRNAQGAVLLSVTDEGLETDEHALITDLPTVVRQRLAE